MAEIEQLKREIRKIKFMTHALKYGDKKVRVHYSKGGYTPESKIPDDTISIYAREYGNQLPDELSPKNDTDFMTDYFDKDTARITKNNPYYQDVEKALKKAEEKQQKLLQKRKIKYGWL